MHLLSWSSTRDLLPFSLLTLLSASCHLNSFHWNYKSTHRIITCAIIRTAFVWVMDGCQLSPTPSLPISPTYFPSWKLQSLHSASVYHFCLLFIPSFGRIKYQNTTIKRKKKRISKQSISHWLFPFLQKRCCNGYGRTVETQQSNDFHWKETTVHFQGIWVCWMEIEPCTHCMLHMERTVCKLFWTGVQKTALHMHGWLSQLCCELCVDRAERLKRGLCKKTASHLLW